jgi:hypothetical protein
MNNYTKRLLVGGLLGAIIGVVAAYAASTHGVPGAFDWGSAMFWSIIFNRMTLGIIIGMGGVFTVHPIITSLKIGPILRGLDMGSWISILLATSMLAQGVIGWYLFWWVLIAGAFVGSAIDWVLTKRYGQGKQLLDYQQ